MIVCSETATNVFVNVGTKGNPQFRRGGVLAAPEIDLAMNSTAKLEIMTLDVEPIAALSATTNGTAMLVSDEDGRIWLYEEASPRGEGASGTAFTLKHKVWGGSYAG